MKGIKPGNWTDQELPREIACLESGVASADERRAKYGPPVTVLAGMLNNRNLLAWFGFEEAARNLASRAGYAD